MIRLSNILLLLLLVAFEQVPKQYRIIALSSETIIIGSEKKSKGDTFSSDQVIRWESDSQVMRVIDQESQEIFVLTSRIADVSSRHTAADYVGLISDLSTDMMEIRESSARGGYHYIVFTKNNRQQKVKLTKGMFMDEYPQKISLYYHDVVTAKNEFRTDDFRGFVDDLIITDNMVKRCLMSTEYSIGEEDSVKNDYMILMNRYTAEKYRHIIYTYDDLKLFLTLKY